MKITRIENSKHVQERVLVYLEEGDPLRITGHELLQFGLYPGMDLSPQLVVQLQVAGQRSESRVKAAQLASGRMLSRKELTDRLNRKGIDPDTAEETADWLEGLVDVYLPDLKYADGTLAAALSGAADYFPVACQAIREMFRQVGPYVLEDGLLKRGMVIRHLVLPGYLDNTRQVLDWIAETFGPGDVLVSLMSQYTPTNNMTGRLARRVTAAEYRAAVSYMRACGITDGFVQERTSAEEAYTPAFDGTGV